MRRILIATPVLALAITACTGTGSYKSQAEDFIDEDDELQELFGADVSDAECDEPDSTDVGTTYQCTATVEGQDDHVFDVLINEEDSFLVTP